MEVAYIANIWSDIILGAGCCLSLSEQLYCLIFSSLHLVTNLVVLTLYMTKRTSCYYFNHYVHELKWLVIMQL